MKFIKLLAIALVLVLTVSMALPVAAASVEIVASGQCGENAYWKLDEDGILFITGNGAMSDFSAGAPAPWANLYQSISSVIVSSGITAIGSNTFLCPNPLGYFNITNITIPRSVTYIAPTAFEGCPLLQDVYYWDTYDQWVELVKNSQDEVLQSVTLHSSDRRVSMCGQSAFWEIDNQGTLIISGQGPTADWHGYTVAPWHDYRDVISKIVVSQGVTHVGSYAFKWTSAKEAILADSVTSIGNYAFERSSLEKIHLGSALTWMGEGAFEDCRQLTAITFPNTLTTIGRFTFRGCVRLMTANLSDGLSAISQETFNGCSSLLAVYIPKSVTEIGWGAFNKTALKNVYYGGTVSQWQSVNDEGGNEALANICYETSRSSATYYIDNINLFCNHSYSDWADNGETHTRTCSACKDVQTANHNWDDGRIVESPKCYKDGTKTYTCTVCNAIKTETINRTEHTYGACREITVLTHKCACTVCGSEKFEDHTWDDGKVFKQPTCKSYGTRKFTCILCNATKNEPIEKTTTHCYGSWIKANDATHKHTCSGCSKEETANHTWNSGTVTKKATCKEEGVKTYTCTACNATKTESIEKLTTHTYDHVCDTDCNVCSVTRTTTHNYKTSWSGDITNHWHECSVCKDKKDVAAHELGAEATATTAQTCTICGDEIAPALGVEETTKPTDSIDTTIPSVPIDQNDFNGTGSPVWIFIVVAIIAIGGVAALVVIKKRKS